MRCREKHTGGGAAFVVLLVGLVVATGCQTPMQTFRQKFRDDYELQDAEIRSLQFFISVEVLAHEITDASEEGRADSVFIVKQGTPGAATEVGPNWLRVSFGSGPGAVFLADSSESVFASYYLATELPDHQFAHMKDQADKVLQTGGRRFRLIYGANAGLLVDSKGFQKLIEQRPSAVGRKAE